MPNVKINLNTIVSDGTISKTVTNWTIKDHYQKYMSYDKGDNYLQTANDTSLTNDIINANYWFRIMPENGYKIIRAYLGFSSGSVRTEITNFEDKIYPQVSGTQQTRQEYLYVEVTESVGEYTFTQDLQNCKSDNNQTTISEGEHVVTIIADSGYIFEEEPTCNMCVITLDETRTIATIIMSVNGDTYLKAYATKKINYYNLTQKLVNCISDKVDKIAEGNQRITFTANDGYEFKNAGWYRIGALSHSLDNFSDDLQNAYINANITGNVDVELNASKHAEQIGTFVNLYFTNDKELSKLSKVRFYKSSGENVEIMDYGTFIYNLMSLPFEIPSDMLIDTATIQLGDYDSNVETTLIKGHLLNINIGNIKVDEKYNNVYDYINTQCFLHLPFVEKIEVNVEYVVNHTITINYVVDLYTGKTTVNIVSDFTNKVFTSRSFDLGYKIPFISDQSNTLVSELKTMVDNDIRTAFIEIVRNIPYDTTTPFGKETIDYGVLSRYTGYIEVNNVLLNVSATNAEKSEIEHLLKQGVFIRE